MHISEFAFALPDELIAQEPPAERGRSRLLLLDRATGRTAHRVFDDLPSLLAPGDLLVVNDTRVFPARLLGRRLPGGGGVECLLLAQAGPETEDGGERHSVWEALVHPGQRLREGSRMVFDAPGGHLEAEILRRHFQGRRTIRLSSRGHTPVHDLVDAIGHVPLPPYIKRSDAPADRDRYQTVYARIRGSIAAPTAGLHFTTALLERLAIRGVQRAAVTLHVGYGTFQPITVEQVEDHRMEPESYEVGPEAAEAISDALRDRRRIVAVGTTTVRVLESLDVDAGGVVAPIRGRTSLFIKPGHTFRLVTGLVTNFHLPRSSLLMLVAALAGRPIVLAAYEEAVRARYRFYSYGDAMLII
jgi:S-adenosylmethionine:tRNA ribosyltransferase-isomerase